MAGEMLQLTEVFFVLMYRAQTCDPRAQRFFGLPDELNGDSIGCGPRKDFMPIVETIKPTLELFDSFIKVGKELTKLPALVLPQYQTAAKDLYEISQNLLTANENLSRWLFKFLYFDFRQPEARINFLNLVRDYRTMKTGPECRQLKFSCADIGAIYHRNIASKLGKWLSDQAKLTETKRVFLALIDADRA